MPKSIVDLKKSQAKTASSAISIPQESAVNTDGAKAPEALTWKAHEFAMYRKTFVWFAGLWGAAGLIVLVMILLKNYTAAALFAIAAFVMSLYGKTQPRVMIFGVSSQGVRIGERLYLYSDLRSFWIFYEKGVRAELSLRSNRALMPYVRAPLGDMNPAKVHAALSRYLPERKHADSAVDALSRHIGF